MAALGKNLTSTLSTLVSNGMSDLVHSATEYLASTYENLASAWSRLKNVKQAAKAYRQAVTLYDLIGKGIHGTSLNYLANHQSAEL